jgi:hypothetical protein
MQSISIKPTHSAHLYLAQLAESPQESLDHFCAALEILNARLSSNASDAASQSDWDREEAELRRSASRALVGMTELYLTDLWFVNAISLERGDRWCSPTH